MWKQSIDLRERGAGVNAPDLHNSVFAHFSEYCEPNNEVNDKTLIYGLHNHSNKNRAKQFKFWHFKKVLSNFLYAS